MSCSLALSTISHLSPFLPLFCCPLPPPSQARMWFHPLPLIDALPAIALLLPHLAPLTVPLPAQPSASLTEERPKRIKPSASASVPIHLYTPLHPSFPRTHPPSLLLTLLASLCSLSSIAALAFGLSLLPSRSLQCIAAASLLRFLLAAASGSARL